MLRQILPNLHNGGEEMGVTLMGAFFLLDEAVGLAHHVLPVGDAGSQRDHGRAVPAKRYGIDCAHAASFPRSAAIVASSSARNSTTEVSSSLMRLSSRGT